MLVLGLTGNIGCGKSGLSNIFKSEFNLDIIDADIISRNIYEDKFLLEKIFNEFGESIRNTDGTLNRKKLGNIVFNDDSKLVTLNNITHPRIKEEILKKIKLIENENKNIAIIDAALLVEGNYLDILDKLLVICCREETQIQRIMKRDCCNRDEAISRINSQLSQKEKMSYADYIIDNSGTYEELKEKAYEFMNYVKENWCE